MRKKIKVYELMSFLLRYNVMDDIEVMEGGDDMSLQVKFPLVEPFKAPVGFTHEDQKLLRSMGVKVAAA